MATGRPCRQLSVAEGPLGGCVCGPGSLWLHPWVGISQGVPGNECSATGQCGRCAAGCQWQCLAWAGVAVQHAVPGADGVSACAEAAGDQPSALQLRGGAGGDPGECRVEGMAAQTHPVELGTALLGKREKGPWQCLLGATEWEQGRTGGVQTAMEMNLTQPDLFPDHISLSCHQPVPILIPFHS